MAVSSVRIRRRVSGGSGAPSSLRTGEIAYNMVDGVFYAGKGDDGAGTATSIVAFAKDGFIVNVPSGGTTGQVLSKSSNANGAIQWSDPAQGGSTYTADGNGIELTGTVFSLNFGEIATGLALASTYAPISHTHSAADITSGTLDPARLPVLPSSVQVVASSTIANLSAGEQSSIGDGSVVTTTDGRRWVYTGSGSKTLEASYIELADITPDWAVVSNKPANVTSLAGVTGAANKGLYFTGAGVVDVYDLSGVARTLLAQTTQAAMRTTGLGLGTMSTQDASNVAITGGTIDNVTIDGGTF